MLRKSLGWTAVLVAVALVAGTAVWGWRWSAAPLEEEAETARVRRETLERTVVATGVIRPEVGAEVNVGSRVSGRVVDLPVAVGDAVAAGDLLARLDATELDARIEQAEAELAVARARRAQLRADAIRRERLASAGILAAVDLELSGRDLVVAEAQEQGAAARLRAARITRGYARIEAPIQGVIADVTTREGETVAASLAAPTFVTIIDLDRLEVRAFVDETDVGRVFVGQVAAFTVDTYPALEIPARVTAIEPKARLQNNVVNYVVILAFETPEDVTLRPEMTAHVRLQLERREDVLTVPRNVVHRRDGREVVTVRRDGAWHEQEIRTGWRTDGAVEITEGLREGEILRLHPH